MLLLLLLAIFLFALDATSNKYDVEVPFAAEELLDMLQVDPSDFSPKQLAAIKAARKGFQLN